MNPAAEIQQSLMPPRIVRMAGGHIASGVLPSYDVGGDWVDYVDNRDGAWIAIADAAGRGPLAAAMGSIALAALRAARRNGDALEQAVETMHHTVWDASADGFFVTALVARWSPVYSTLSWVNAGHPPPLVLHEDGSSEALATRPDFPLGLFEKERTFRRSYHRLGPADRAIFYTDGISGRPTRTGVFGRDGIVQAARAAEGNSASAIARAIQVAVVDASEKPLRDDAAVVVLAPGPTASAGS
jgi:serine phosphatase RsbU (regulator of sigma subunit)